jgi:outer membrane immunogenic protein
MRRLVVAGVLASAIATLMATQMATQVLASDLPTPAPPPRAPAAYVPAVVAQVYNWGGFYFGANAGYGFGTSNWTDPNNHSGLGSTGDFSLSGFVVGPTVGVNFQTDAFVYGAEADFDGSWIHGGSSNAFCGTNVGFPGGQCDTKSFFISTGRARFGYAADRVLFYGTGGAALGDVSPGINNSFQRQNRFGWTAGAGIEAAFTDNLTARIEYLFVDLGDASCNTTLNCGLDKPGIVANDTVKFSSSIIRLGVDYKLR